MTKILALLSSLKLAVILLVLLLLGLAAGTIIESRSGVAVAGRLVYFAPWFLALQGLFVLNLLASIVTLFPWGRFRIGYLMTHASMVLILVGALVTFFFKTEGMIGLWEGSAGNVIDQEENGQVVGHHTLPFSIHLVDFQLERYPGTMRPSQFRSLLVITDPETGASTPSAVWMNHPLTVKGYTIFQSSYQQDGGREASVFSVSKDPGEPIVFFGYGLLVLGMIVVLGTRIRMRQRMAALRDEEGTTRSPAPRAAAALLLAVLAGTASAASPEVESLRRLPVQHDGRTMPFDTYARELVWHVTGSRAWQGQDPVETAAVWLNAPAAASAAQVIKIGSGDLAAAIGLPGAKHVALDHLMRSPGFGQLVQQLQGLQQRDEKPHGVLADTSALLDRAEPLQEFLRGSPVRPVPVLSPADARWEGPPTAGLAGLLAVAGGPRLEGWPSQAQVERELSYNALRPTRLAWIVLALALGSAIAGWRTRRRVLDLTAAVLLVGGFALMTWGIGLRWAVGDRIPAANMYESLLFLAWGVGLFAVIAIFFIRNRLVVVNASAGAALTMLLTDVLPMDGFIHPIAPVLSGTPWLAIHVPIIMVGYSVLALGVIVAHMQIVFSALGPKRADMVEKMADLNYWYMFIGSILLIAGILTGSVWAASSWGRYWGWDPKEVWSLVAFLAYMAIMHGRVDRILGRFGVAALSIVAFQTILMTYLGVNYVLGTGLHSYGFGNSPIVTWMAIVALTEIVFLTWGWAMQRRPDAGAATAA